MIILAILGYGLLITVEFIPQYKNGNRRDFWVNTSLGIVSFTIVILLSLGIKIPSPEKPIREIITMIFGK